MTGRGRTPTRWTTDSTDLLRTRHTWAGSFASICRCWVASPGSAAWACLDGIDVWYPTIYADGTVRGRGLGGRGHRTAGPVGMAHREQGDPAEGTTTPRCTVDLPGRRRASDHRVHHRHPGRPRSSRWIMRRTDRYDGVGNSRFPASSMAIRCTSAIRGGGPRSASPSTSPTRSFRTLVTTAVPFSWKTTVQTGSPAMPGELSFLRIGLRRARRGRRFPSLTGSIGARLLLADLRVAHRCRS